MTAMRGGRVGVRRVSSGHRRNPAGRRKDLGVLFVHGVGDQERGQTLSLWGDALTDWLRGWSGDDAVDVTAAHLVLDDTDPAAPAYLDLTVSLGTAGSDQRHVVQWRLAEAWWAQSFGPPRFREMAVWGFTVAPYALIGHFVSRLERAWVAAGGPVLTSAARIGRVAASLLEVAVAVLLAPLAALAVLVVLLLSAVPVTRVRALAASLQRAISRTVGDSFILLGSATRAAAIVHRVEHDVRWLADRSDALVVVAHSQGAEVAHRAVRSTRPRRLRRLVTVGSGQTKLAALSALRGSGAARSVWFAPAGAFTVAASVAMALDRLGAGSRDDEIFVPVIGLTFGLGLLVLGARQARGLDVPADDLLDPGARDGWLDLYASHDPVSNGPVYGVGTGHPVIRSEQVDNLASAVSDHTGYARNVEQVVARLAEVCAAACDATLEPSALDQAAMVVARRRRSWRVGWLRCARVVVVTVASVVALLDHRRLPAIGRGVLTVAADLVDLVPLVAVDVSDLVPPRLSPALGGLAVLGAFAAAYGGLAALWHLWGADDVRRLVRRAGYPLWSPAFVVLLWAMAALVALVPMSAWSVRFELSRLGPVSPEMLLIPVFLLLLGGILGLFVAVLAWPLTQLGLIRTGHFFPTVGEMAAVFVPGEVIAWGGATVAEPGSDAGIALLFGIVLVVPVLSMLAPALLSSSPTVQRLLSPARARARAGPIPFAAHGLPGPAADDVLAEYADVSLALIALLTARAEQRPAGATTAQDRALDDARLQIVEVARARVAAGRTAAAVELLRRVADQSVEAGLLLVELRPSAPEFGTLLRSAAAAGTWRDRRRVGRVLGPVDPGR
jgi:hypothetical protein